MTVTEPRRVHVQDRIRAAAGRPFGRSVARVAGANTVIAVAGSVGGIVLARSLGPTARGELVTVLIWPAMVGSLAALGTTQATCYLVARSARADGPPILATAVAAATATGLLVAGVGGVLAPLIARTSEVASLLRYVFFLAPAYIAVGIMASALQARHIPGWNLARASQPLVYLAGIALLAPLGRLTLGSAVAVFCLAQLTQLLVAAGLCRKTLGPWVPPQRPRLRPLYAYGARSWLASVPQIVNVHLDLVLLSVFPGVSAAQLANYSVAAALSWLALPLAVAFGSVAFPAVAGARTDADALRVERTSLFGAAAVATLSIVALSGTAHVAVPILFGRGFDDAVVALWLLAPGTVCLALNRVLGDLIRGRGRPLSVSVAEGVGTAVTFVLLFLLIPRFGINGAAVASSSAYATVTLLLLGSLRAVRRGDALAELAGR